jgi:hypothetical protein
MMEQDLRYPIGKFERAATSLTQEQRGQFIAAIANTPARLAAAVMALNAE